jgi:single-strand DNA-binding protein
MSHHKLIVVGRLVGDPKSTDFSNGGKVAKFGLPIDFTRAKKNPQTGEWEGGDSFIINVDVFNRDNRPLADMVMQYLRKGSYVYVEGRLKNNEYTDKAGVKVARPVLVADTIEFMDNRGDGNYSQGGMSQPMQSSPRPPARQPAAAAPRNGGGGYANYDDEPSTGGPASRGGAGGTDDEIPF